MSLRNERLNNDKAGTVDDACDRGCEIVKEMSKALASTCRGYLMDNRTGNKAKDVISCYAVARALILNAMAIQVSPMPGLAEFCQKHHKEWCDFMNAQATDMIDEWDEKAEAWWNELTE